MYLDQRPGIDLILPDMKNTNDRKILLESFGLCMASRQTGGPIEEKNSRLELFHCSLVENYKVSKSSDVAKISLESEKRKVEKVVIIFS